MTEKTVSCPAFTTKVVDRVGAGDAVFAMTSILHLVDADPEVIALMGNLSGASSVSLRQSKAFDPVRLFQNR